MGYSLNRAVPLSIVGFIAGAGFVILLRGLQSMDELWNPQLGLVIGGLFAAVFFLWGIGGLSSTMAGHHVHEPEEDEFGNEIPVEDHHGHEHENPASILSEQIWTITFWTMTLFVGLLIFAALPGGFGYTLSLDAAANANTNGFFPVDLGGGNTLYVSKLVAFILFTAVTMLSLFAVARGLAAGFVGLNRGIKEVKVEGNRPLTAPALGAGGEVALLASGEVVAPAPASVIQRVRPVVTMVITAVVLYVVFYEVAIGLILPQPYTLRIILSLVNAIVVTLLIFRPKLVLFTIGRIARFSARVVRAIPAFLFQRD